MAELKYFTPILKWLSVVADESTDLDADPQTKGIFAGCTVTPTIAGSDARAVRAEDLTPSAALLALAPFEARLDDGRLMLRADSDKPATAYANLAAFPLTGDTGRLYRALDTDLFYEWNGTEYVLSVDYARLKLLANCPVLELPDGITIWYEFRFHHVTYNGSKQDLPTITIAAPTIAEDHDDLTDGEIVVNLATSEWVDNLTPVGGEIFVRNVPDDVGLVGDDVQFYRQGLPLGDPLDLLITGVPADMDDITDATAPGKAVVRAATASAQRDALQIPSYFRRVRNIADSNGTDDTAAVQAILAEGAGEVVFRKGGTWIIDANPTTGMLKPLSNTRVIIEEGATVQVKTNALDLSYLFQVNGVSNVTIEGMGTLLGDALVHTGSTGQYGHLINITNSSDVRVKGPLKLTHAWGDGIYIGGGVVAACADILVDGVIIEDCRREGISPFWVDGCTIRDCRITDIASTAYVPGGPGSGIDVEPNDGQYVNNLTIENNYIAGTAGNGMYISTLPAGGVAPYTTNVIIRDNHIEGCGVVAGGALTASGPSGFTNGIYVRDLDDPIIENNTIINTGFTGDTGFVSTGIKSYLCDRPMIKGNTVSGSTGAGVLVTGGTSPEIVENTIRNNAQRGISTGLAGAVICGNQVFDNNQAGGSSEHHVSIAGDGCAVVGNVFRGSNGNSWVRISSGTDSLVANNVGIGTAPTNKLSDAGTTTRKSLNVRVATGVYESWDVTGATPMGTIELGHATDTTVSRSAAGQIAVEGVAVPTISSTNVITNKDLTSPTNTFPELVAAPTHAATSKATPVDADEMPLADSAASFGPKKLTWANLKATLAAAWINLLPTGTVMGLFNTSDQVTNYERARHYWSSNAYTIETDAGGSGTLRDLQMVAANNQSIRVFGVTQASTVGTVRLRANLSAASGCIAGVNGTLSAASGVQYGLSISPTINQTVTAGYVAVLVNVTETGTGSGAKLLADLQVGGTSRVKVDNTGTVTLVDAANVAAGTTTGTKVGTATSQKLGFWNATPIVQPTTSVTAATFTANSGTAVNDASTFDGYTVGQVVKALRNAGLLA